MSHCAIPPRAQAPAWACIVRSSAAEFGRREQQSAPHGREAGASHAASPTGSLGTRESTQQTSPAVLPSPLAGEGTGMRGRTSMDAQNHHHPRPLSPQGRGASLRRARSSRGEGAVVEKAIPLPLKPRVPSLKPLRQFASLSQCLQSSQQFLTDHFGSIRTLAGTILRPLAMPGVHRDHGDVQRGGERNKRIERTQISMHDDNLTINSHRGIRSNVRESTQNTHKILGQHDQPPCSDIHAGPGVSSSRAAGQTCRTAA